MRFLRDESLIRGAEQAVGPLLAQRDICRMVSPPSKELTNVRRRRRRGLSGFLIAMGCRRTVGWSERWLMERCSSGPASSIRPSSNAIRLIEVASRESGWLAHDLTPVVRHSDVAGRTRSSRLAVTHSRLG